MATLRLIAIVLLTGNLLLLGIRMAGYPRAERTPAVATKIPAAPTRRLPSGLATITLADEVGASTTGNGQCFTLGPFETEASRGKARTFLRRYLSNVDGRETEALMELGYWVALGPYEGLAQAVVAERELRGQGIEDVAVVAGEGDAFLVSLGYYLGEENALLRRDQIRELGHEAMTRLRREHQQRFWLDFMRPPGAALSSAVVVENVGAGLLREIPCVETG